MLWALRLPAAQPTNGHGAQHLLHDPALPGSGGSVSLQAGMQIIALGVAYIVAVTALDVVTNVGAIDDLTSTARIVLVQPLPAMQCLPMPWPVPAFQQALYTCN